MFIRNSTAIRIKPALFEEKEGVNIEIPPFFFFFAI